MDTISEAVPKSVHERISRKIRRKNFKPKDISLTGRIAVKKTGDSDPRSIKDKIAENILKYYNKNGKPMGFYKPIIENLISDNIDNSGNGLDLTRLNEMNEETSQFTFLGKGNNDKVSWIRFKTNQGMVLYKIFSGDSDTDYEISSNYPIFKGDIAELLEDVEQMFDYNVENESKEPDSLEHKINSSSVNNVGK